MKSLIVGSMPVFIIILILFYLTRKLSDYSKEADYELYKKGNIVVGKVISYSSVETEFECIINGKKAIQYEMKGRRVILGERFNLVYDKESPRAAEPLYGQPIIQDSSLFAITTTETIDDWEDCGFLNCLGFSYIINGKKIEKEFYSDWFFPNRYKKIDKSKKYKVIYNIMNPMIAYPILEDSIKVVYPISKIK